MLFLHDINTRILEKNKNIIYPNIASAKRPLSPGEGSLPPVPPKISEKMKNKNTSGLQPQSSFVSTCSSSPSYTLSGSSSPSKEPYFLKQPDLNDLVRDLGLSKSKAQLLGSRLNQWNLLDKSTRVSYFRTRQEDFTSYFSKVNDLVYCNDAAGLLKELSFPENSDEWRLFFDASKISWNAVLLHIGNKYPSVPLAHATNMKENYADLEKTGLDNPSFVASSCDLGINQSKKLSIKDNEDRPLRNQWGNKWEFLMSCVAMSVGLGNIWRFPFVANRNGGGAFLIPYIIVLIVVGRPMYFMEMALGQFSSRGCAKMYQKLSPVFRGIGIGQVIGTACVASYYCVLMAITLFYLINSFTSNFPWATCQESWSTYLNSRGLVCIDRNSVPPFQNNTISSSEMYFRREVLKEVDNISDGIGLPDWKLSLLLLFSWFITFLVSAKGVKSSGKASYFLALFPYVIMITLLIRSATLEGASEGMKYFIATDWSKLLEADVWYAAVTQCFFSLNVGFGNIVTLASYNSFNHNINRDAFIVTTLDTFTSLLSGLTIFGILGNLAHEMQVNPSEVVSAGGGTGLAFISYPDALSKFEFAPWLFAITFFFMLFVLGIGSLAALHGNVNSLIKDSFPTLPDWIIAAITAICLFFVGLIYITPGGQYTLDLIDYFGGTFVIFMFGIIEVIVVCWLYGIDNLCTDMQFMTKKKVGIYWRMCWGVIQPILLIIIFFYFIFTFTPLTYGVYNLLYPIGLEVLGWGILAVSVAQFLGWLIYYLYVNRDPSIKKMIAKTFSMETWGPDGQKRTYEWLKFKEEKIIHQGPRTGSWITKKLKILVGK